MEGEQGHITLVNGATDKKAKGVVEENNFRRDKRVEVITDSAWVQKVAGELGRQLAAWPATHLLFGEMERQQIVVGVRAPKQPALPYWGSCQVHLVQFSLQEQWSRASTVRLVRLGCGGSGS